MLKLSPRLQKIVSKIPQKTIIADVGCDHGKVVLYAVKVLQSPFVFGSDISEKSVEKTRILLTKNGIENFKTLTSDGLNGYTVNELNIIETVVIAGMGGHVSWELLVGVSL